MMRILLILLQGLLISTVSTRFEPTKAILSKPGKTKSIVAQSQFTEPSTNIEYVFMGNYNDYRLYKLILKYRSTPSEMFRANQLLEKYLQESFETPDRFYPNVLQVCGSTMLAFFASNTTVTTRNIHALLLSRLEAYGNSEYICYLSVLKEHRQKGLGTKLLNELINEAMRANYSQVTLHVNTENTSAMSLYLKCGMRGMAFLPGYYHTDRTYPTQNAFNMLLELKHVRNPTLVCQSSTAIEISPQAEAMYKQKCPQAVIG